MENYPYVGVIPNRFIVGVGGDKRGTTDWRYRPTSPQNTRGVRAQTEVVDLETAWGRLWPTPAYQVGYVVYEPNGERLDVQPRVNKAGLAWMRAIGYSVRSRLITLDVDYHDPRTDAHSAWDADGLARWREFWSDPPEQLRIWGRYLTPRGYRCAVVLEHEVEVGDEYEGMIRSAAAILARYQIRADPACADWTRLMRVPHWTRDDMLTEEHSPTVVLPSGTYQLPSTPKVRIYRRTLKNRPPVGEFAEDLPLQYERLCDLIANSIRGKLRGYRHMASLALSGALLEGGMPPEFVPVLVYEATRLGAWDNPHHHRKNAVDTVAKWESGELVRSSVAPDIDELIQRFFNPESLKREQVKKKEGLAILRNAIVTAPEGPSLIVAPCGIGKSFQATSVAIERARAGQKTVISCARNDLAIDYCDRFKREGVTYLRLFGPANHKDGKGNHHCKYAKMANSLAAAGQSVRQVMCEGYYVNPCRYRDNCDAYRGQEGDESADIVVTNHGLIHESGKRAGVKGLLVVDEPPEFVDAVTIGAEELDEALNWLQYFENGDKAAPIIGWLITQIEGLRYTTEPTTLMQMADGAVDYDPELVCPEGRTPHIDHDKLWAAVESEQHQEGIKNASRVLTEINRAWSDPYAQTSIAPDFESGRPKLEISGWDHRVRDVVRREGRTVLMSADIELSQPTVEQLAGDTVPVTKVDVEDGCPVLRLHIYHRNASQLYMIRNTQWLKPLESAMKMVKPGQKALIITWRAIYGKVRKWCLENDLPHAVHYYGALRGTNQWADYDVCITLGDPRPNLGAMARVTALHHGEDLDMWRVRYPELRAAAELEQAHGRLRTIHREKPATMVHVGGVRPSGWMSDRCIQIDMGEHVSTLKLNELFSQFRTYADVAKATGLSVDVIKRLTSGLDVCTCQMYYDLSLRIFSTVGVK